MYVKHLRENYTEIRKSKIKSSTYRMNTRKKCCQRVWKINISEITKERFVTLVRRKLKNICCDGPFFQDLSPQVKLAATVKVQH
jgi:hypothetical protein